MTTPQNSPDEAPLDPVITSAVESLRTSVPARPSAIAAVKLAIANGEHHHAAASLSPPSAPATVGAQRRWVMQSRPLHASPFAIAAGLLMIAGVSATIGRVTASPATIAFVPGATSLPAAPQSAQVVRFTLSAPAAHAVALVGDFNAWDPMATALQQRDGTWTVVIPVTPGRHQYGFVVDGAQWIADPSAPQSADGDFGTANSVVYVGS